MVSKICNHVKMDKDMVTAVRIGGLHLSIQHMIINTYTKAMATTCSGFIEW